MLKVPSLTQNKVILYLHCAPSCFFSSLTLSLCTEQCLYYTAISKTLTEMCQQYWPQNKSEANPLPISPLILFFSDTSKHWSSKLLFFFPFFSLWTEPQYQADRLPSGHWWVLIQLLNEKGILSNVLKIPLYFRKDWIFPEF